MRWLLFFSVVIVFTLAGLWGYTRWGRTYINNNEKDDSILSGFGEYYGQSTDKFVLIDKNTRVETWVIPEDLERHNPDNYIITFIPSQNFLGYAVGEFYDMVDIEGSMDKYLLLKNNDVITSYRVVFELNISSSQNWSYTHLDVEHVRLFLKPKEDEGSNDHFYFYGLDYDQVKKIFNKGDVVAVIPQRVDTVLSGRDENHNVIASSVIVRRSFGFNELKLELSIRK